MRRVLDVVIFSATQNLHSDTHKKRENQHFVLLIVPSRYFSSGSFCFMSWCLKFFVLLAPYVCFHIFS